MSPLEELQKWYRSQCNGDWEHSWGVKIGTLDNPGWELSINLADTNLSDKKLIPYQYGIGKESEPGSEEWIICKVENFAFKAYGGPFKLEEMITIFLKWKDSGTA